MDHREDSTFSFDPANINVRKLSKHKIKKIDARKGVLLSSYTRKKTRRRKRGRNSGGGGGGGGCNTTNSSPISNATKQEENRETDKVQKTRSVTPSPSPSPRHSGGSPRPHVLPLPPPKHVQLSDPKCPDTLRPTNTLGKYAVSLSDLSFIFRKLWEKYRLCVFFEKGKGCLLFEERKSVFHFYSFRL